MTTQDQTTGIPVRVVDAKDPGRCFQTAHFGIADGPHSAVACADHVVAELTGFVASLGSNVMRVFPLVTHKRCDFRFDADPRTLVNVHPDLMPAHDTGCGCGYHTALRDRGAASCGHPANEDGECDCSCWPELCTHDTTQDHPSTLDVPSGS